MRPYCGYLVAACSTLTHALPKTPHAVKVSRDMIGMTNPLTSAPGTVRGDLAVNIGRNVIHGSDGVEGAETEIPLWFQSHELVNIDSTKWPQHVGLYLYDTKQA